MNIILFDTPQARIALKPFSFIRSLAQIRIGIVTVAEKWQYYLPGTYSFFTTSYLSQKFPRIEAAINLCIQSTICPDKALVAAIQKLQLNEALFQGNALIAFLCDKKTLQKINLADLVHNPSFKRVTFEGHFTQIKNKWDLFLYNEQELKKDFTWICAERTSQPIHDPHTVTYHKPNIFVEEGAVIKAAILNAEAGPIYIGKNALLQEGTLIKGPVAIGEGSQINMGAKLRQATTIGPYSRIGGEVNNTLIFGYSNKAHDGFLGNSVIGEWCNLGAGTNTSNLRNDYSEVKVWDYAQENLGSTHLQFCGLFMGDYSKSSINTMFNAGTVTGISVNLFGTGFCDAFVPSFTWGGKGVHTTTYGLKKAFEVIERTMQRRERHFTEEDKYILTHIFRRTAIYRTKAMM